MNYGQQKAIPFTVPFFARTVNILNKDFNVKTFRKEGIPVTDPTDIEILKHLNRNCRIKINRLAELVHLTAPAVAARIQKMEDDGVIKKYTIEVDLEQLGFDRQVFIQVALKADKRSAYDHLIRDYRNDLRHHYRTTGESGYLIEGAFSTRSELTTFLARLEELASYKVIDVIGEDL